MILRVSNTGVDKALAGPRDESLGSVGPQTYRILNFDRGHPVVLIIKLQVYIYILISVRAQQYYWYI